MSQQRLNQIFPSILICISLLASIYLSLSHYRVFTDITYQSLCAISKSVNCDTVSQSPWAILWGVPVPAWAIIGYGFFLFLFILSNRMPGGKLQDTHAASGILLLLLSAGFCIYSIVLAAISTFLIQSYCLMCIVLHVMNFGLLIMSYLRIRQDGFHGFGRRLKNELNMIIGTHIGKVGLLFFTIIVSGVLLFYPSYWKLNLSANISTIPSGITEDGHFYLGAPDAAIDVVEYADYQCFQCKKMHVMLRRLLTAHPGRIRLIHRHFPMDHLVNPLLTEPFHTGSGKMAMLAIYAGEKGKFWPMNDVLFQLEISEKQWKISEILEKAGISIENPDENPFTVDIQKKLLQDIISGLELEITSTPSYLIEGKVYQGQIPVEILNRIIS